MKAAVVKGRGKFVVEEVPTPVPEPGDVLIKVICCGICGSDLHFFASDRVPAGATPGHEWVGTIAALGAGVSTWKLSQRVVMAGYGRRELGGLDALQTLLTDPEGLFTKHPAVRGGGFGEYLVWDAKALMPVPDNVSDELAALTDTFAVGVGGVECAGIQPGDSVLIMGAGPIGLSALMGAKLHQPGKLLVTEMNEARKKAAMDLGADEIFDPSQGDVRLPIIIGTGGGPAVIIDCVGNAHTIPQSAELVKPGGKIVLVGISTKPVQINPLVWVGKGLRYEVYSHGVGGLCLKLFSEGKLHPESMITDRVPLTGIQKAFEDLVRPTYQIKTLVYPNL